VNLPRTALAAAIALVLSACSGAEGNDAASPTPSKTSSPTTAAAPSPTPDPTSSPAGPPAPPGRARCTLVLGFSVTANWFLDGGFESLPGIDDARWELIWESGHDVMLFAEPGALPYGAQPLSPCAEEPDRVLFQVAARDWQVPDAVTQELQRSVDNIRATWPSVEVIELIPIVGGPGGGQCPDPRVPNKGVQAALMNPPVVEAIARVANGTDVVAGPDLLVADCAQFRDGPGHLSPDGSAYIAGVLAEHYGS
jgi:hypothetical protein